VLSPQVSHRRCTRPWARMPHRSIPRTPASRTRATCQAPPPSRGRARSEGTPARSGTARSAPAPGAGRSRRRRTTRAQPGTASTGHARLAGAATPPRIVRSRVGVRRPNAPVSPNRYAMVTVVTASSTGLCPTCQPVGRPHPHAQQRLRKWQSWQCQPGVGRKTPPRSRGGPRFVATQGREAVTPDAGAPSVFRVRVGKFKDRREADAVAARLQKEEQFNPWIVR